MISPKENYPLFFYLQTSYNPHLDKYKILFQTNSHNFTFPTKILCIITLRETSFSLDYPFHHTSAQWLSIKYFHFLFLSIVHQSMPRNSLIHQNTSLPQKTINTMQLWHETNYQTVVGQRHYSALLISPWQLLLLPIASLQSSLTKKRHSQTMWLSVPAKLIKTIHFWDFTFTCFTLTKDNNCTWLLLEP